MTSSVSVRPNAMPGFKPISFGRNSAFDVLFILMGGLPFWLPFILMQGEAKIASHIPLDWLWWGNQLVSMPHTWATLVRLNRKINEKRVSGYVGWPAFVSILGLTVYSMMNHLFAYVWTTVQVWQSFHYLRQGYGISRFFGRPQGETDLERSLCSWAYNLAMPLFILGRWHYIYIAWQGKTSDNIIPVFFPEACVSAFWVIAGAGVCIGLALEVLKYRRASESYDASGLVSLLCYYGMHWYGFVALDFFASGFTAVTVYHAMQYLAITWKLEERQNSSALLQTRLLHTRLLQAAPILLSFIAFGAVLYFGGDFIETKIFTMGDWFWPSFSVACLSTMSTYHYFVDTFIWHKNAGL